MSSSPAVMKLVMHNRRPYLPVITCPILVSTFAINLRFYYLSDNIMIKLLLQR